jgi:hypothetical protein
MANMNSEDDEPSNGANSLREGQPASSARFDSYRSLAYSDVRIIVASSVVPPFRFKAGGWEISQSSIEVGTAIAARITENGFFMFRINEDQGGGIELTDLPNPSQETEVESE